MTTPLKAILRSACCVAKQNLISKVVCPQCGERQLVIKWGRYHRYLFDGDQAAAGLLDQHLAGFLAAGHGVDGFHPAFFLGFFPTSVFKLPTKIKRL